MKLTVALIVVTMVTICTVVQKTQENAIEVINKELNEVKTLTEELKSLNMLTTKEDG